MSSWGLALELGVCPEAHHLGWGAAAPLGTLAGGGRQPREPQEQLCTSPRGEKGVACLPSLHPSSWAEWGSVGGVEAGWGWGWGWSRKS